MKGDSNGRKTESAGFSRRRGSLVPIEREMEFEINQTQERDQKNIRGGKGKMKIKDPITSSCS